MRSQRLALITYSLALLVGVQIACSSDVATSGGTGGGSGGKSSSGGSTTSNGGGAGSGGVSSEGGSSSSGGVSSAGGSSTGGSSTHPSGNGGTAGSGTGGSSVGKDAGAGGAPASGGVGAGGASFVGGSSGTKDGGPRDVGPSGSGGSGLGGSGPAIDGGGAPPAATAEDDGADCTVGTVPGLGTANAKLPDPFTKIDGTKVATKADWRCRREEIKQTAQKIALGTKPPKPATVTGTVTSSKITVNVTDGGKSSTFSVTVTPPKSGKAPYPAIIFYTAAPIDQATLDSEGIASINYNPYDVGAEGGGHSANQKGAFYSIYSGGSGSSGLLVAWAWGVSRIIDVIEQSDGTILKADAIGVTGCSRFGKGSFMAGVMDQRVALTMPIESGTDGVPIWRGIAKNEKGENGNGPQSLSSAYSEQPWYADASNGFTSDPTKTPVDTHELVAMIAPRGLFIMENPHIGELASKYGHVAALGGAEVYKALGAGGNISYNSAVQSGTHCSARPEWTTPQKNNIEWFLKKTGTPAGVITAASTQTGDLSTWRDWTTPTLN